MSHKDHVNYVQERLPLLTPTPRKRIRLPQPQPLMDLDSQLYRLLNSTHHLLNSTNPTWAEDCWLCLSPSLSQVLTTHIDPLDASPGNKLDLPLARPNIPNIKLTHPAPQCLQSSQGSIPLGEVSKCLCSNITQSMNNTQYLFFPGIYCACGTAAYTCLPPS
jgi:hypothetical protein